MKISSQYISPEVIELKRKYGWPIDSLRYEFRKSVKERFVGDKGILEENGLKKRAETSLEKLTIAKKYRKLWNFIPWIKMVLITGSVASLNALPKDDIDFWVICQERRIWLTRLFDWIIFSIAGMRRLRGTMVLKDTFCINFYKTEENLQLKIHDVSYASQLVDAIVIKDQYGMYHSLIQENSWIKKFFPVWYESTLKNLHDGKNLSQHRNFLSKFGDIFEYVVGAIQIVIRKRSLQIPPKSEIFVNEMNTWAVPAR